MPPIRPLFLLPVALLVVAPAMAQNAVPAPIYDISLDEWISASARLAAGRPLAPILALLNITEAQWKQADAAFTRAIAATPPGDVVQHYSIVFSNPNSGRFAIAADAPMGTSIHTFGQFARIQAEMAATREAGQDTVAVLRDRYGLTPFAWSQQEKQWLDLLERVAQHDPLRLRQMRAEQDAALTEARTRVGGPTQQP